jgi:ferric-dicitrate binding protein FerR (iron transport regulator)
MKDMKKYKKFTEKELKEYASVLSGENGNLSPEMDEGLNLIKEQWKGLEEMNRNEKVDVDKAWNNVYSRIQEEEIRTANYEKTIPVRSRFLQIAASLILLAGLGAMTYYFADSGLVTRKITVTASEDQRNISIDLPDGSHVFLNRNSRLTYPSGFRKDSRMVKLTGEAYFDIAPDASKPFIIDAGKANVRVVGTSFNVITENTESSVEVYVKTGKVLLSDKTGEKSLILDPGFVGRLNSESLIKSVNTDPNYLSWNTGRLVYKNQKLEVVFKDLKKVYNMDIVADDPSIPQNPWTSPIDYQPQDRIIQMICLSFNLNYTKDGNVYHLSKK